MLFRSIFQEALSPKEMQGWLDQEIRDSTKAYELRITEAKEFVNAFVSGELTQEQAMQRLVAYDLRWGEALYGATATPETTDEAILAEIDRARRSDSGRRGDRLSRADQQRLR